MRSRLPPSVLRLLAALLLLQAVLAPALCLAAGNRAVAVEICTAEGLRTVHHLPDGDPADGDPAGHVGACLVCHALPQGAGLSPPVLPQPTWAVPAAPPGLILATRLPPGIHGPPGGARGPPAFA